MEKTLPLLTAHLGIGIAENEADGCEEVTFTGTIAADDDVGLWRKGLDDGLFLVATMKELATWGLTEERRERIDGGGVRVRVRVRMRMRNQNGGWHGHSPFEALDNDLFNIHDGLRWR